MPHNLKFNKTELIYVTVASLFAFIVFGWLIPYFLQQGIENTLSPYIQFLVFNIGIFTFLQIFLPAITLNHNPDKKRKRQKTLNNILGGIGILALFMALDIIMPPLMVSTKGELLSNVPLSASASDYIFGLLATNLGLHGFEVYAFTYIIMPVVLLILSALLLPNFVKNLK